MSVSFPTQDRFVFYRNVEIRSNGKYREYETEVEN